MKDYYQKSMRALQLAGMSERTQQSYTRAVRQLVDFYKKKKRRTVSFFTTFEGRLKPTC